MRTGVSACALVALAVAAGCGGSEGSATPETASPRAAELGWRETGRVADGHFVFRVDRLVVERERWTVHASIENRTGATFFVTRPKRPGQTSMGLAIFPDGTEETLAARIESRAADPPLRADHFLPALPRVLGPGAVWRGTFSGPGRLPRGQYVRVHFGHFANPAQRPDLFSWVTDHAYRL